jgi:hypothetical protein
MGSSAGPPQTGVRAFGEDTQSTDSDDLALPYLALPLPCFTEYMRSCGMAACVGGRWLVARHDTTRHDTWRIYTDKSTNATSLPRLSRCYSANVMGLF